MTDNATLPPPGKDMARPPGDPRPTRGDFEEIRRLAVFASRGLLTHGEGRRLNALLARYPEWGGWRQLKADPRAFGEPRWPESRRPPDG